MENLYYTVKKETEINLFGDEHLNGLKLISAYSIDTQTMGLIVVCEIHCSSDLNSEAEIQTWLDINQDEQQYNFVEL